MNGELFEILRDMADFLEDNEDVSEDDWPRLYVWYTEDGPVVELIADGRYRSDAVRYATGANDESTAIP